jgi:hypothetical protein
MKGATLWRRGVMGGVNRRVQLNALMGFVRAEWIVGTSIERRRQQLPRGSRIPPGDAGISHPGTGVA